MFDDIMLRLGASILVVIILVLIKVIFNIKPKIMQKNETNTQERYLNYKTLKDIYFFGLIILLVFFFFIPTSMLNDLVDILVYPGMISGLVLLMWYYIFGKRRIIKFSKIVKSRLKVAKKVAKFENSLTVMNILLACIIVIFILLTFNIYYNTATESYRERKIFETFFILVLPCIYILIVKKSLLPQNIDEILENTCELKKLSKGRFIKNEIGKTLFKFNYNISKEKINRIRISGAGFRISDARVPSYYIYSEVVIDKNSLNRNK